MLLYSITIFISAFLLFQVQPLIAKYILPWFGGTPAVWTTAMLFFQVFLLLGYAYAHFSINRLKTRTQVLVHLAVLAVALVQLPITPSSNWQPVNVASPAWHILALLTVSVGLPYFVLSSTAPLIQAWFSRAAPDRSPYRLYALSNGGSLLALLSYPFAFEPTLGRQMQAAIWSVAFGGFVLVCAGTAIWTWRQTVGKSPANQAMQDTSSDPDASRPAWDTWLLWLLLPFVAVVMLLAITNQMSQDIAVIPFLWILPLSLYLLTFIIAFDNPRWYRREVFGTLMLLGVLGIGLVLMHTPNVAIGVQIGVYSLSLFVCCMVLHGEVSRMKPSPIHLTGFYLTLSLGGALGGIFVGLVAPAIFTQYLELPLGLLATLVLAVLVMTVLPRWRLGWIAREFPRVWIPAVIVSLVLLVPPARYLVAANRFAILTERNFYGTLAVWEEAPGTPEEKRWLLHGAIYHGAQYTAPVMRTWPITYFAPDSGVGLAMRHFTERGEKRVGVVGLGIGTLAAYGEPGDVFRFYEINPAVESIARRQFTYLDDSRAQVEVVLGDARLSLEQEPPQQFDLLVLDAFSGDAPPVHLLTAEAFAVYLKHLAPGGVIAVNVTNRNVDLAPVVMMEAKRAGLAAMKVENESRAPGGLWAEWMLVSNDEAFMQNVVAPRATFVPERDLRLWTDDYTSLYPVLSLGRVR